MSPGARRLALIAHVTTSVGWIGAVIAFLALSISGLRSVDAQTVRSAYLGMALIAWCVILPLAFASLVTGFVQSLGTNWGLIKHYWILAKLGLTSVATVVLVLKMTPITYLAGAVDSGLPSPSLHGARLELLVHAVGGLVVLLIATILSVFKPWGLTSYGRRDRTS